MSYSIKHRERRYVKNYGFLSFTKNIGKNVSNKYDHTLVQSTKKSETEALQNATKTAI